MSKIMFESLLKIWENHILHFILKVLTHSQGVKQHVIVHFKFFSP